MASALNWFEIPAVDFDRAVTFYETILAIAINRAEMGGVAMGIFPHSDGGVGGHIQGPSEDDNKPSSSGTIVYLDAEGKLDASIERVEGAGGKILLPKMKIDEEGYIALVLDTEGNKVGLHAMNP
ncbi:MAG: VOC family protein [Fimbriimonas sp.]